MGRKCYLLTDVEVFFESYFWSSMTNVVRIIWFQIKLILASKLEIVFFGLKLIRKKDLAMEDILEILFLPFISNKKISKSR